MEENRPSLSRLLAAGALSAGALHELRNTLAVVSSSLFLARRDRGDEARLLAHLDRAASALDRAQASAAAVLALARGDALPREPVDVASLIEAAQRSVLLPPSIALPRSVPEGLRVSGSHLLLERLLANLYLNACEALAGRAGTVATSARLDGHRVELVVEDDGPGIAPSVQDRLFEPLATSKRGGTGLGLALVKAIAEAHDGNVSVSQIGKGGTRFILVLPR